MPQYLFRGRIELDGATFCIDAENEEEAKEKASAGSWDDLDIDGAASRNWTIHPETCELNE